MVADQPARSLTRCLSCPNQFGKLVGSRGPIDSPIVIVGESPGRNEIRLELPFVGPSGDLLNAALAAHPDVEPYITNAHICFPGTSGSKTQDKTTAATKCCHLRLAEELKAYPRKIILALGAPALWSLTNNYGLKITQVRGKVFPSEYAELGVVASVHPSYLLRGQGSLRQFLADVDYAFQLAKGQDFRNYVVPRIEILDTPEKIYALADHYTQNQISHVAADTETGGFSGFDHLRDRILCAGFCHSPDLVQVVPGDLIEHTEALFRTNVKFIWHNGKFDVKFFRQRNVPARVDEDTMLLSYAIDETKGIHDLEQISSDIVGAPDWKYMIKPHLDKSKFPKGHNITYADIPSDVLYDYMSRDISSTLQIFPVLRRQVASDVNLERLYTRTLIPMSSYFMRIEEHGLRLDLEQVRENDQRLTAEIERYATEINNVARAHDYPPINPNSPQQLEGLLYDKLQLKINNRRPQGTDVKTLEKLPQSHPAIIALKKYRKVKKAHSTYVVPAPSWVSTDGRVHTSILIHGTATGRPASRDPNLFNIPRDPLLRGQFAAAPGYLLVEIDASQAELRVLAELSQDPLLVKIYTTSGMSIHDETCDTIFGKIQDYDEATLARMQNKFFVYDDLKRLRAEQKMKAKNVNFGIPYGISAYGLAEQIDDTPQVAQEYLNLWYQKYAGARAFLLKCRESVTLGRELVTAFGRKKRFGVVSPERLNDIQNEASNFFMQSIVSDIISHVGMEMQDWVEQQCNGKLVNTVYDSLIFEVPNSRPLVDILVNQTCSLIPQMAKYWGIRTIPFIGEAKIGKRWGQTKDLAEYKWEVAAA